MKQNIKSALIGKIAIAIMVMAIAGCQNAQQETQGLQRHDDSLRAAVESEINAKLQNQNDSLKAEMQSNAKTVIQNSNSNSGNVSRETVLRQQNPNIGVKENELINAKFELNRLNTILINAKSRLEFERNELVRAEQFHLGRLTSTRQAEIRQQDIKVQGWQNAVQKVQEAIIEVHNKILTLQNDISNAD